MKIVESEHRQKSQGTVTESAGRTLRRAVGPEAASMKLEHYLRRDLGLTAAQVRSMKFRPDGITVNGVRARVNCLLSAGDIVELRLDDAQASWTTSQSQSARGENSGPHLLYEDEDLAVVWKEAGEVVHPAHGHYADTLSDRLHAYFEEKGERAVIRSIGRLDKDTSGMVVFAKNRVAAGRLWRQKEEGIFRKEYLAVCEGRFAEPECGKGDGWQKIEAPVAPMPGTLMKMHVAADGKPAVTYYRVEKQYGTCALVRVRIKTGRTHQIRVHMAYIGHPLAGDALYGGAQERRLAAQWERLTGSPADGTHAQLCAWKVCLRQPFSGEEIRLAVQPEYVRNRRRSCEEPPEVFA